MLRPALVLLALFTLVTGLAYPAVTTWVAQLAFPRQANGDHRLIGQPFDEPRYFWGRPSAASYDGAASTGSNLGPSNPALKDAVEQRIEALRAADPGNDAKVPVDLVTASGSGLDPDISPAAAAYQVSRVARARKIPPAQLQALVDEQTEGRTLGLLGEPRINVLRLNLALDRAFP